MNHRLTLAGPKHMPRGDFIHLMTKFKMLLTAYKSLGTIVAVFVL